MRHFSRRFFFLHSGCAGKKDFKKYINKTVSFTFSLGFIADGNSFLLGNVLLRQIRIADPGLFPAGVSPWEQVKPPHQHQEDTENYGVNWGPLDTNITKSDSIWHYQNQETLGGSPIQGEFATYSGGGYAVKLGRNSSTAAR